MGCKPRRGSKNDLAALVAECKEDFHRTDAELDFYRDARRPFLETIHLAACGLNAAGKMNSHQTMPGRNVCEQAAKALRVRARQLKACASFEELLAAVKEITDPVAGFGELCQYDAALRIGARLDLEPEYVYLHRGALKGAKRFELPITRSPICRWRIVESLPPPLKRLRPAQVENFLCWYHGDR